MSLPDKSQYLSAKLEHTVGLLRIHTTVLETNVGGGDSFQSVTHVNLIQKKKICIYMCEAVVITNSKITLETQSLYK